MNIIYKAIMSGINFNPLEIMNDLDMENFLIEKDGDNNKLILVSKDYVMVDEYVAEYDQIFVDFFENNYELLMKSGAEDFQILIDVRFREQCNFEIFSPSHLKILSKYNVSFPMKVTYDKTMFLRGYSDEDEFDLIAE